MFPYDLTQPNQSDTTNSHPSHRNWTSFFLFSSTEQQQQDSCMFDLFSSHPGQTWTTWVASVDIRWGVAVFHPTALQDGSSFVSFVSSVWVSVSDAADLPADGLFLVSDARLPECTVGLFQAESDGSLQVIFVVACQVNHIYTHAHTKTRGHWIYLYAFHSESWSYSTGFQMTDHHVCVISLVIKEACLKLFNFSEKTEHSMRPTVWNNHQVSKKPGVSSFLLVVNQLIKRRGSTLELGIADNTVKKRASIRRLEMTGYNSMAKTNNVGTKETKRSTDSLVTSRFYTSDTNNFLFFFLSVWLRFWHFSRCLLVSAWLPTLMYLSLATWDVW